MFGAKQIKELKSFCDLLSSDNYSLHTRLFNLERQVKSLTEAHNERIVQAIRQEKVASVTETEFAMLEKIREVMPIFESIMKIFSSKGFSL